MSEWDEDRKVVDAATPGPWTYVKDVENPWEGEVCGSLLRKPGKLETPIICTTAYRPDGTFIAKSRTRWLAALDEIGRLKDVLASHERAGLRLEEERDALCALIQRILSAWLEVDGCFRGPIRKYLSETRHEDLLLALEAVLGGKDG
jgi:hypothetical protein